MTRRGRCTIGGFSSPVFAQALAAFSLGEFKTACIYPLSATKEKVN